MVTCSNYTNFSNPSYENKSENNNSNSRVARTTESALYIFKKKNSSTCMSECNQLTFTFLPTTKCWNHLPLKLRASSTVNKLKNALYKHFKLSHHKNKVFTPFLDNNF